MWLRVLGAVQVRVSDTWVDIGPARQRAVLAALLVEPGKTLTTGQLIDRVWGDTPPPQARKTLYTYLFRLRATLRRGAPAGAETVIVRRSGGYAFVGEPTLVDLHRFRALAAKARRERDDRQAMVQWRQALELWRGEAFEGLDVPWLRALAAGLEAERRAAVLDYYDVMLRCGEHGNLLPELSAAASADPLDERLACQLMLALYRSGRQRDAIGRYQFIRQRLRAELGNEPGPELRQLYQQILRQDPALTRPARQESEAIAATQAPLETDAGPPAQLPSDISGFVGRETELRLLDQVLADHGDGTSAVSITVISGGGGVGKTALAIHWAHRVRQRFPHGQLYVNLRGFDPAGQALSREAALRILLELLQVPPERIPASMEAQAGLYRSQLANKRMLILLDNARDVEQVRPLLPGAGGCLVVVTSRNSLEGLVATEGARPVALDVVDSADALHLLTRRLGTDRVAAEPGAARQIITACAGLPLALAIVAARAATYPTFPLQTLADELTDAQSRLDAFGSADAATDLRAVFACSYGALSPPSARLFRLLGLHPGPDLSVPVAASLAGVDYPQARLLLTELTRAHLINQRSPGRYSLHDLLRVYAHELAHTEETATDRHAASHRMFDHYLHTGHAAAQLIQHYQPSPLTAAAPVAGCSPEPINDSAQAVDWFRAEYPAVLAAITHAAESGFDEYALQLPSTLLNFFHRHGRWHDLIATQQVALTTAKLSNAHTEAADAHRLLGHAYGRLGQVSDARAHLYRALEYFQANGDRLGCARTHLGLSWLLEQAGDFADGMPHNQQALAEYQAVNDIRGQSIANNNMGLMYARAGETELAIRHCRRAIELAEECGAARNAGFAWDSLGTVYQLAGDYPQAASCYQQALRHRQQVPDLYAGTLTRLAETYRRAGNHTAATAALARAITVLEELGHPDAERLRRSAAGEEPIHLDEAGAKLYC